jgi:hypothetical protein
VREEGKSQTPSLKEGQERFPDMKSLNQWQLVLLAQVYCSGVSASRNEERTGLGGGYVVSRPKCLGTILSIITSPWP